MFSMQFVSKNLLITTFQLTSAASLNFGRSQNGVLWNELTFHVSSATVMKMDDRIDQKRVGAIHRINRSTCKLHLYMHMSCMYYADICKVSPFP